MKRKEKIAKPRVQIKFNTGTRTILSKRDMLRLRRNLKQLDRKHLEEID